MPKKHRAGRRAMIEGAIRSEWANGNLFVPCTTDQVRTLAREIDQALRINHERPATEPEVLAERLMRSMSLAERARFAPHVGALARAVFAQVGV
jgi:hypothetical protein